eukprot:scaffold58244_cov18-Tisochrysis_lutea.AAC.1
MGQLQRMEEQENALRCVAMGRGIHYLHVVRGCESAAAQGGAPAMMLRRMGEQENVLRCVQGMPGGAQRRQ